MPYLPSSWSSWFSQLSSGRKRTWPKNKFGSSGARDNVESGEEVHVQQRRAGRLWYAGGSEESTRELYHEKLGQDTPEKLDVISGRFTEEKYGEAV